MKYLSIRSFDKHQHYKDRRPPWIKLHAEILDDYEFLCLQDASKAHLMLLWVLASKLDNRIPYDLTFLSRKLGTTSPVDVEELVLQGFVEVSQDDSKPLARRKQGAMPETETETETEKEAGGARGFGVLPKADCDRLYERWCGLLGSIPYPRFRKALLVVRASEAGRAHSVAELDAAIEAYSEWHAEQDDREQRFLSLEKGFADQIPKWVRYGQMPHVENGEMTERGRWAGSKALRAEAIRLRSA